MENQTLKNLLPRNRMNLFGWATSLKWNGMAILQLLHTVKVTNDTNSQIFEFGNKQIKFRQLQQSVTFGHNSELNCGISTFFLLLLCNGIFDTRTEHMKNWRIRITCAKVDKKPFGRNIYFKTIIKRTCVTICNL